ncbi:glutathione S-transferase, partial [Aureobasidium namibiae CBS 147.97]
PKEARDVGAFEQAASVEFSYLDPIVTKLAYERSFKNMMGHGDPDAATVASLENNLKECLDYYERILASQDFVAGRHATLVDLFHVPWLAFLPRIGLQDEISSRENVKAWGKRLQDRPAWQKISERAAH